MADCPHGLRVSRDGHQDYIVKKPPKVAKKWIRNPSDELAIARGCTFDLGAGEHVAEFLESFCKQSIGEWKGQPLTLLNWQRDIILRLYGWMRPDGTRRFRKGYIEVPKKNGKSTLISGLALYHLVADGEDAPEIYLNACNREQAEIVFNESKRMIEASPNLSRILDVIDSKKRIVYGGKNGVIKAQSKETASKDGLNSSLVVFDELHRQPGPEMWRVYRHSGASRRQPLILSITTAGHDRTSVCYAEHEYTEKVNEGKVQDIGHFGVIFGADQKDDFSDPAVWRKANPSLGTTIREDDFAEAYAEAVDKPSEFNEFLRLRLNVWTNAAERFLRRDKWDACGARQFSAEGLQGEPCYCGLDLSTTTDMTAFVALTPDGTGSFFVSCLFWLPEENLDELERKSKAPYRLWADRGFLKLTPGNVVDYDQVRADLKAFFGQHPPKRIMVDRWNATQLAGQLQGDGFPVEFIGQGFSDLTGPTKELERLVLAEQLHHGNNPVLNWHIDNAMAVRGENEAVKLSKSKSTGKIDGAAALVNGIAGLLAEPIEEVSVYNERGVFFL